MGAAIGRGVRGGLRMGLRDVGLAFLERFGAALASIAKRDSEFPRCGRTCVGYDPTTHAGAPECRIRLSA
jgi:hypothetical protein